MPKVYFASDFHLGAPNRESSLLREKKIVRWLDEVCHDADVLILLGDVFDFWFEFKHVVPKGYTRLLGKLASMHDNGTKIYLFKGNHDMWMFGYLTAEIGAEIISDEWEVTWNNKRIFLHHGDGLGPGDPGYKLIKRIFRNRFCQWLFAFIHPFWGMSLAQYFSSKSRLANERKAQPFDEPNEWLLSFCKEKLKTDRYDFMIFGHRHLPLDIQVNEQCRYINLGEWVTQFHYAVFDGTDLVLKKFE